MEVTTRYGIFTVSASDAMYACTSCALMAALCAEVCWTPERMNAAPRVGTSAAPTALNDCAKLSRRSELSGGPRTVTYGLAPTSRKDCPQDMTNKASKKNAYCLELAAGKNSSVPAEQMSKPTKIPLRYPIFSIKRPAGKAARKYPPKNAT